MILTFDSLRDLADVAFEYQRLRRERPDFTAQQVHRYLRGSQGFETIDQYFCSHRWAYSGTAYGGDDERWHGEGRCYCLDCGLDGDG